MAGRDRDPGRRMVMEDRVRHRRRRDRGHREVTPDARLREGARGGGREVLGEKARVVADDGAVRRLARLLHVIGDRPRETPHVRERVGVRDPRAPSGGPELDRIESCHHPCTSLDYRLRPGTARAPNDKARRVAAVRPDRPVRPIGAGGGPATAGRCRSAPGPRESPPGAPGTPHRPRHPGQT